MNTTFILKLILGSLLVLMGSNCEQKSSDSNGQSALVQKCAAMSSETCKQNAYSCRWNIDKCDSKIMVGLPALPSDLNAAKQIKADKYVCMIDKNDELWCLDEVPGGDSIIPHPSRKFAEVETQGYRVCGVLTDGQGMCFTSGKEDPSLNITKKLSKLYPFGEHTCGIYADGKVFCDGDNNYLQQIEGLAAARNASKATHLLVTRDYYLGILFEDKELVGFNFISNKWGLEVSHPIFLTASVAASQIAIADKPDFCAIQNATSVLFCAGGNYVKGIIAIPAEIATEKFTQVSVGHSHTCGILGKDQTAKCWGGKSKGQLQIPANLTGTKSIVAGNEITCWIDSTDVPHCVGRGQVI